jgi:putative PIN family toxin of toxin-antitoxin system
VLKLVVDTNILIASIGRQSQYRWIFDALINKKIIIFITNEILLEYFEILSQKNSIQVAENVVAFLLSSKNVIQIKTYFSFQIIDIDKEDNKFIDCVVASNAHFLISNDNHFNILKTIEFPAVSLLTLQEFEDLYKHQLTH